MILIILLLSFLGDGKLLIEVIQQAISLVLNIKNSFSGPHNSGSVHSHFVKSVHIWRFSGPYFPTFGLLRMTCHLVKMFFFENLRDFLEERLIFLILKCSVLGRSCYHWNMLFELLQFRKIWTCYFWYIERCHFREIEISHFLEITILQFLGDWNVSFSGDWNMWYSGDWNVPFSGDWNGSFTGD